MTSTSEAARQLAALVPTAEYVCAYCGKPFVGKANQKEGVARTCKASCRQMLYVRRKKEREAGR